jgi:methylenetetrahydrofolate reductase (NADPH)
VGKDGVGEFSVEVFPPKTPDSRARLRVERRRLEALRPSYFSVTCGAGGSPSDGTYETIKGLRGESSVDVAPHLTCLGLSQQQMRIKLAAYLELGVRRLVALRGDWPASAGQPGGDFRHASDLVVFIRAETGDRFKVQVAAHPEFHPEAESAQADLEHFKRKVDAGANAAITQYFYNADAYFRFVESCRKLGVDVPIVPGIMPITDWDRLARQSSAMGVEIPRWLRKRLDGFGADAAGLGAFGLDVVTRLCRALLDGGAPGLHFYTMNHAEPTVTLWRNLGLPASGP